MANVPGSVIQVDEERVRGHVDEVVRSSVEETLNGLLDAEADSLCNAKRYERTADRVDTRDLGEVSRAALHLPSNELPKSKSAHLYRHYPIGSFTDGANPCRFAPANQMIFFPEANSLSEIRFAMCFIQAADQFDTTLLKQVNASPIR